MKKVTIILALLILVCLDCSAGSFSFESFFKLNNVDTRSDRFVDYIALFSLGIIGLIALFISSERLRYYEKKIQKEKEKKKNLISYKVICFHR